LLAIGAAMQASSVINASVANGQYGITTYNVAAAILALLYLERLRHAGLRSVCHSADDPAVRLLLAYFLYAAASALLLPPLFDGTPVFALNSIYGFGLDTTPLEQGISHFAQAINAVVHLVMLLYLLDDARHGDRSAGRRLRGGLLVAGGLAALVGLHERFALAGWLPSSAAFWMNNPGYAQGHGAEVAGILRISAPFSEPSYGSTFLAALLVGLLAIAALGRHPKPALAGAAACSLALLNTLGSTGLGAAALVALLLLVALTASALRDGGRRAVYRRRTAAAWAAVAFAILGMAWLLYGSPWGAEAQTVFDKAVLEKVAGEESLSTTSRLRSNMHAISVALESYGLGVGLGSNHASSFLASLLSNVGLPGMLLYLAVIVTLLRRYVGHWDHLDDGQLFALWALLGASAAMYVGIPDLNFPLYWLFVFLAIIEMPRGRAGDSTGKRSPEAAAQSRNEALAQHTP